MKKAAVWTVVVVTGLGVYGAASGQSEIDGAGGSGAAPTTVGLTPDTNLTIIEQGHQDDSTRTYRRIATLLDLTQSDCPDDSREHLADMTANVIMQLDEAGVSASPIEILEAVRESSSLRMYTSCGDYFGMYLALRRDVG